ncbi:TIGR00304 family protein [Thermococcus sp.]|uniref:TIGR00304 family membrane protein n=1 Tax=Thermococcus sp. TaxID=35749 RepID=UPI0025E49D7E|nr:TIGR00304 family protein [Thermococcus sp.]
MRGEVLIGAGIALILIGFLLVFIGTLISAFSSEGNVEGGGVIMIGPIPIVFGTSRGAVTLASLLALLLMVLWIVGVLLARRG